MRQLDLDIAAVRPALGRADFQRAPCNAAALGWIERWPDWPNSRLIIYGPPGSGKTHLAGLWRDRSGGRLLSPTELAAYPPDHLAAHPAVAIDDADQAPERSLLHLYNCCAETGASLLLTARTPPRDWPFQLADLASRMRAAPDVGIDRPDDELLAAMLVKQLGDRQLRVRPDVVRFVVPRMERSFAATVALVEWLGSHAPIAGRRIDIPLAKQALAALNPQS